MDSVTEIEHRGERYVLRPIGPADESALRATFALLSPHDVRMRFFSPLQSLSPDMAARLANLDRSRELALVLLRTEAGGGNTPCGVVRLAADPGRESAEFAIVVITAQQGKGLGRLLMTHLIGAARALGMKRLVGNVLAENTRMLELARSLGFESSHDPAEPGVVRVEKSL